MEISPQCALVHRSPLLQVTSYVPNLLPYIPLTSSGAAAQFLSLSFYLYFASFSLFTKCLLRTPPRGGASTFPGCLSWPTHLFQRYQMFSRSATVPHDLRPKSLLQKHTLRNKNVASH